MSIRDLLKALLLYDDAIYLYTRGANMLKTILKTKCPHCGCSELKSIGFQKMPKFDLELANCTNKDCQPYTLVIAKIEKLNQEN